MIDNTINDDKTIAGGEDMVLAGRYRILRRLGQGGMGAVWLAEDRQLDNRKVAIKMLPSIVVTDKRAYQQLKSEALVSLKLIHPNIVTLRAFEENNGAPFLVMDYIEGRTLSDYLAEKGKLSESETIKLLKPIAAALDYAHGEKVIHRDVKPSNIIIRKDGHPFILDFGIAREIQESMTRVTGRTISGTLLYMSPEQLRGAPPAPAQDVYSFAAMCYECLSGNPPFTKGEIAYQIVNENPMPLAGVSRFAASVMAGLSKKPEGRPNKCTEVLGDGYTSRGVSARAYSEKSLTKNDKERKGTRTRNLLWIAGVALAVGLVVSTFCMVSLKTNNVETNHRKAVCSDPDAESLYKQGCELIEVKDVIPGMRLVREAAEKGFPFAQYHVGWAYENGQAGLSKDFAQAVQWYKRAAENRVVEAQYALGMCYYEGRGVGRFYSEAAKWLNKAARQGHVDAQYYLGNMYNMGRGVTKNSANAFIYYRMAAKNGSADAQKELIRAQQNKETSIYHLLSDKTLKKIAAGGAMLESMTDTELDACIKEMETKQAENAIPMTNENASVSHFTFDELLGSTVGMATNMTFSTGGKAEGGQVAPQQESSVPSIYISAMIDGNKVNGAILSDGVRDYALPVWWSLKEGKKYGPYKITLLRRNCRYVGVLDKMTVDWCGTRRVDVALKEAWCLPRNPEHGQNAKIELGNGVAIEMIYCKPGSFLMGSRDTQEGRFQGEKIHRVCVENGFWLGKYEVTQKQWQHVMGANPSFFRGENLPVENVSWNDVNIFLQKINSSLGCEARLPTQKEWEYACRSAYPYADGAYAWGNSLNGDLANCNGNIPCGTKIKGKYARKTTPVGSYKANDLGFFDMHGNVWEWCSDGCSFEEWDMGYVPRYLVSGKAHDNTSKEGEYALKGGGWNSSAAYCRSAYHAIVEAGYKRNDIGFRLCVVAR